MNKSQVNKWTILKQDEEGTTYINGLTNEKCQHSKSGRINFNCGQDLEKMFYQPEIFIEKGCLDACKALWDLNITTIESNGWEKDAYIVFGRLSDENMEIFKTLAEQDPEHYEIQERVEMKMENGRQILDLEKAIKNPLGAKFGKCCVIRSDNGFISTELIKHFELQDIYEGVFDSEQFLTLFCGYFDRVFEKFQRIKIFDKSKQTKSIEEYAKEKGAIYVKEEDKVYLSQFYYDRHLKYLDYLKQKNETLEV